MNILQDLLKKHLIYQSNYKLKSIDIKKFIFPKNNYNLRNDIHTKLHSQFTRDKIAKNHNRSLSDHTLHHRHKKKRKQK